MFGINFFFYFWIKKNEITYIISLFSVGKYAYAVFGRYSWHKKKSYIKCPLKKKLKKRKQNCSNITTNMSLSNNS